MALVKQGGNPQVMTTRGPRDPDKRLCHKCGEKKSDGLFTVNGNGQIVCPDCAGTAGEGILRGRDGLDASDAAE